ncbi:MAG: hypothetical protein JWO72_2456 [Caulobacteraceae bacterium]|jgi:predicted small lipoprotein YifL|nr:hypothetical protein [Caulobacteraceae bacterium]
MRRSALLLPLMLLVLAPLAGCGHDRTTIYAPAGSTVVVPDDGHTKVITPGG